MLENKNNNFSPKQVIDALIILDKCNKIEEISSRISYLAKLYPDSHELYQTVGAIFLKNGNYFEAKLNFQKAIKLKPNCPNLYNDFGITLIALEDYNLAKKILCKANSLFPDNIECFYNLGNAYKITGDYNDAITAYQKCLTLDPFYFKAYENLFIVFQLIKNIKKSEKLVNKAIKKSNHLSKKNYLVWQKWIAMCFHEIAESYESFQDWVNAKKNYYRAIQTKNDYIPSLNNLGNLLFKEGLKNQALKYFKISRKFQPKNSTILNNIAVILIKNKNFYLSSKYLEKAFIQKQGSNYLLGNLILCYMNLFKHKETNKFVKNLKKLYINKKKLSQNNYKSLDLILFFITYSNYLNDSEIFKFYKLYDKKLIASKKTYLKPILNSKKQKSKLKIGYVSPDFKKHSIKGFLEPVLSNHNHDQFEIYAFAELSEEDPVTQQYKSYVDHWIPTQGLSDEEMVQKIRELQIDILVDLAGHTKDNRLLVFARKPAPVSLTWLGYGYTTGLSAIDYFLTDKITAPKGSEHLFSEQIWQLNHYGHCCYQEQLDMGHVGPLPALEKGHITFGTLTRAIRINDRVIKAWSQILKRVKHSKLVINSADFSHYKTKRMIISKFEEYGVKQNCLEVGYQSPPWDTMRQIDIALDCFPHNSGTTLIEHLYMGNPFVTYSNRPSVGKIGASILTALGRREWIAYSEQEYIDKAVALATDTKKLASIRSSLREEMKRSPIMDHKGFVRELERTYQSMWDKWCADSKKS